jgi:hypothetical protein
VDVSVEGVPQHLGEERKPKFALHVNDLFQVRDLKLLLDAEAEDKKTRLKVLGSKTLSHKIVLNCTKQGR